MADPLHIDLFCEDLGHELFCRELLARLAAQENRTVRLVVRNAQGGAGRALQELKAWQSAAGKLGHEAPDLLVIVVDANCQGWNAARAQIAEAVDGSRVPRFVVGCPDPHVERWCIADPQSFAVVVGAPPPTDPGKCQRDLYKRGLRQAIQNAGQIVLGDPMEYAPDLVRAMDLFRAGKAQPSLKHFVDELTNALRGIPQ